MFLIWSNSAFQGDSLSADAWFSRALSLAPNSSEALHHFAQHLVETKRLDKAVQVYRKALEITPKDFEMTFNLANCFRQLGQNVKAEAFYRRAVVINPEVKK